MLPCDLPLMAETDPITLAQVGDEISSRSGEIRILADKISLLP